MYTCDCGSGQKLAILPGIGWFILDQDASVRSWYGPPERYLDPTNYLRHFDLYLTRRCNGSCAYCYQESPTQVARRSAFLDVSLIRSFVERMKSLDPDPLAPRTVELFGGEPLLHPSVHEILAYLRDEGFLIRIATNGTLPTIRGPRLRPYWTQDMHVRVTLDGHTASLHEHFRTPGSFERVVENIRYLTSTSCALSIKTIVSRHNFPFLPEILAFVAGDLRVGEWNYNALYDFGLSVGEPFASARVDHAVLVRELTGERYRPYWPLFAPTPLTQMLRAVFLRGTHRYLRLTLCLNWDGGVYFNDQLINRDYCLGAADSFDLDRFLRLADRLEHHRLSCRGCVARDYCFLGNYGELYAVDPSLESSFPTCRALSDAVTYLMTLGRRGEEILAAILAGHSYDEQ